MKEERLYIVGYMASGKTTLGRALAMATGREFLDLDEEISRRDGRSVAHIIEEDGEAAFREKESRILKETASMKGVVIACGGGTPCFRDNMEFMTLHGQTLWLVASPGRIAERILEAGPTRPLAAGKTKEELISFVTDHLRRRQPHYFKAMWRFSGEHLENEAEITASAEALINELKLK